MLEFVSTDWVMCTYNPPWPENDADAPAAGGPDAPRSEYDEYDEYDEAPSEADIEACRRDCERVCRDDCDEVDAACEGDCREQCVDLCAPAPGDSDDGSGEAWSCPNDRPELW